jgi:hypothetical protein
MEGALVHLNKGPFHVGLGGKLRAEPDLDLALGGIHRV